MSSLSQSFPSLSKAPIVEAIIDFRIRSSKEPIELKVLESFYELIKERYPTKEETRLYQSNFVIDEKKEAQHKFSGLLSGYRFESIDKKYVLQISPDGFTMSHLQPYSNWSNLLDEAKNLFDRFKKSTGEFLIIRVATRFINKLEIPSITQFDFDDYLTAAPKIPTNLPQITSEFLSRNVIPCTEESAILVLTQSFQNPVNGTQNVSVIIDIDAFVEKEFQSDSNDAWETLETLRDLKNRAFFGFITPKTVELLK